MALPGPGGAGRLQEVPFRNRLLSLDASVIGLRLLLDHGGYPPSFAALTKGGTHGLKVARQLAFEPGAAVVSGRGYSDYKWFAGLGRRRNRWGRGLEVGRQTSMMPRRNAGGRA